MSEANKPVKVFRVGGVSATVWENSHKDKDGKENKYNTVAIERSYKDKKDEWQKTSSMRVTDLPKVVLASNLAFEYLSLKAEEE